MIFLDTNVLSEAMRQRPDARVMQWISDNDAAIALSTVVVAEVSFGIERIRPEQRSLQFQQAFDSLRRRYRQRIYAFDETAALLYGKLAGGSSRRGLQVSMPDGMISAIAIRHGSALATRNIAHFQHLEVDLINPWES